MTAPVRLQDALLVSGEVLIALSLVMAGMAARYFRRMRVAASIAYLRGRIRYLEPTGQATGRGEWPSDGVERLPAGLGAGEDVPGRSRPAPSDDPAHRSDPSLDFRRTHRVLLINSDPMGLDLERIDQ